MLNKKKLRIFSIQASCVKGKSVLIAVASLKQKIAESEHKKVVTVIHKFVVNRRVQIVVWGQG